MLKKIAVIYISSFKGLSKEMWLLSFAMLVNRAGTMVIPFMSLYLTSQLNFSLEHVAWVLSSFGIGAVVGSYLGGILVDKRGFYNTLLIGLTVPSVLLIRLAYVTDFYQLCLVVFITSTISEFSKPAAFVGVSLYSNAENRTRSVSLLRLSIHLGLSLGPALGGFMIMYSTYKTLFIIDGVTCLLSGIFLLICLKPKETRTEKKLVQEKKQIKVSRLFMNYLAVAFIMTFAYIQLLSTFPLFYKNVHFLTEDYIGLLIGINGFLIFIFEMPFVYLFEKSNFSKQRIVQFSLLLFSLSFLLLQITHTSYILILSILCFSLAQAIGFPFLNTLILDISSQKNKGRNMGYFAVAVAIGKLLGLNIGLQCAERFGFNETWIFMTFLLVIGLFLLSKLVTRKFFYKKKQFN